jgi:sporulation integral membrane protein YtvI
MDKKIRDMLKMMAWIVAAVVFLKLCLIFLSPFVAAVLLAFILEPIVRLLCRAGITRKISVLLGFAILLITISFVIFFMSNYIYEQLIRFIAQVPHMVGIISSKLEFFNNKAFNYEGILRQIEEFIPSYKEKIINTVMNTMRGTVSVLLTAIVTIYLSMDLYRILSMLKAVLPASISFPLKRGITRLSNVINVEMMLIGITTLATILGLYLLGIDEPLTVGIICGILDILPVVGPGMILIPWSIYSFFSGNVFLAIGIMILFVLIGVLRQVMEVKYVGGSLHVHPVTTLFSLYTGVMIYGAWGVILGPVLVLIIQELLDINFEGRKRLLI